MDKKIENVIEMLPCPFCGKRVDLDDDDTLYPTGIYWRITDGVRHYIRHKNRLPDDNKVWGMHCPETSGGCGVEIHRDSREECIDAWNRRPNRSPK